MFAGIMDSMVISEEDDEEDDDEDEDGKKKGNPFAKKVTKEDVDLEADVSALFAGEDLSEEFKQKATTIFEAAVVSKINEKLEEITEETDSEMSSAQETLIDEMSQKVDSYLEYVVEEWTKDNTLAIEHGIKNELTEDFIRGLKGLFEDHYIDVPEDKLDVVEEMGSRIEELEKQIDEQIDTSIELRKETEDFKKSEILEEVTDGLVDTQVEKLRSLSEGVEFETPEDYHSKITTLKENYFPVDGGSQIDDVDDDPIDDGSDDMAPTGPMSHYVKAISKTTVK